MAPSVLSFIGILGVVNCAWQGKIDYGDRVKIIWVSGGIYSKSDKMGYDSYGVEEMIKGHFLWKLSSSVPIRYLT